MGRGGVALAFRGMAGEPASPQGSEKTTGGTGSSAMAPMSTPGEEPGRVAIDDSENAVPPLQESRKPMYNECALIAWRGMKKLKPELEVFDIEDLVGFIDNNWSLIYGRRKLGDHWPKMVRRIIRHGPHFEKKNGPVDGREYFGLKPDAEDIQFPPLATRVDAMATPEPKRGDAVATDGMPKEEDRKPNKKASLKKEKRERDSTENRAKPAKKKRAVESAEGPAVSARVVLSSEWTEVRPPPVKLSDIDRASVLSFLDGDERLSVRGHKGFRMVRATHGVMEGDWYFEVKVLSWEGEGAIRVGWSTRRADTETPVGYDDQGYALRDRTGEFFHKAKLRPYGRPYGPGDVIGCRIWLPEASADLKKSIEESDYRWLEFRLIYFLQGNPPPDTGVLLHDAYVEFFINGESLGIPGHFCANEDARAKRNPTTGVRAGMYFPSIALYRAGCVSVNFGPSFAYEPPQGCRPMCEAAPVPQSPRSEKQDVPAAEPVCSDEAMQPVDESPCEGASRSKDTDSTPSIAVEDAQGSSEKEECEEGSGATNGQAGICGEERSGREPNRDGDGGTDKDGSRDVEEGNPTHGAECKEEPYDADASPNAEDKSSAHASPENTRGSCDDYDVEASSASNTASEPNEEATDSNAPDQSPTSEEAEEDSGERNDISPGTPPASPEGNDVPTGLTEKRSDEEKQDVPSSQSVDSENDDSDSS